MKKLKVLLLFCLIFSNYSQSALTATTASVIQGAPPEIRDNTGVAPININDVINIELPDGSIYFGNSNLPTLTDQYPKIFVDKLLKFSDFKIGLHNSQYYSSNGDNIHPTNGFTYTLNVKWTTKYGEVIPANSTDLLDSCKTPYELDITMNNVQTHSEYGYPSSSVAVNLNKKFYIYVNDFSRICGLKPLNMAWFTPDKSSLSIYEQTGTAANLTPDPNYGGGVDISQFDPILGFDVNSNFPTTAFLNAAFSIVLPEPQTDYNIAITPTTGALSITPSIATDSYHTKDNLFKFISKPTNTVNINISHKYSSATTNYSFTVQNYGEPFWGSGYIGPFISTKCNLFPKWILSNSPQAASSYNQYSPNYTYYNAATRAVGTFVGEWGVMDKYPSSGIGWGSHWSAQQYDATHQWTVHLSNGATYQGLNSDNLPYFCKM